MFYGNQKDEHVKDTVGVNHLKIKKYFSDAKTSYLSVSH